MKFQLKCKKCGETFWIKGHVEGDTNATILDEKDSNWNDACEHIGNGGEYEIIDSEYEDYSSDDY